MTRNDSDWIRDFYLLITGVDNGVYEVEYPNGSDGMAEGAFYDRLGADGLLQVSWTLSYTNSQILTA